MKIFNNFRYLFLATLAYFSINVNAQKEGSIDATPKLTNNSITVINNKYGILGSNINSTITCVAPTFTDGRTVSDTKVYRVYQDAEPVQVNVDKDNDFIPTVGLNQSLHYKVVFTINDKNGNAAGTKEYESDKFQFSIYDSEGYTVSISNQPVGAAKNIYAGSNQSANYEAKVGENGKLLPPFRFDWTNDKDNNKVSREKDEPYTFSSPSKLEKKTDYRFTAQVVFLEPETSNVWFYGNSSDPSDALAVYSNKPEISNPKDYLHFQNVKGNATHNGVECVCLVDFSPTNYGKFIYDWKLNGNSLPNVTTDRYTFTPSVDNRVDIIYHVTVKCVNPDDDKDSWYTVLDEDFAPLTICLNPKDITFKNDFYSYPEKDGIKLFSHTGQSDRNREYKVTIPNDEQYGTWIYEWVVQKDDVNFDSSDKSSVEIKNTVGKGSYKTSLTLKCVNPKDPSDIWLKDDEIYKPSFKDYVVYSLPYCYLNDEHVSEYKLDDKKYSMYVNNRYDTEKLYTRNGGYENGWKTYLYVKKDNGDWGDRLSSTIFEPTDIKDYELMVEAINLDPEGNEWESYKPYNETYTFTIYPEPSEDVEITIGSNEPIKYKDIDGSLDITKGENLIIKTEEKGGADDKWNLNNTTNISNFTQIEKSGLTLKLEGNRYDELKNDYTPYRSDVSFSVSNTPTNIIKGCEHTTQYRFSVNQWKSITATFKDLRILDSYEPNEDVYKIVTCEGLNNNKEVIKLRPIGGIATSWTADWIPVNEGDPSFEKLPGEITTYFDDNNNVLHDTVIVATFEKENSLKADDGKPRTYRYTVNAYFKDRNAPPKKTLKVDIITYPKPELKDLTAKLVLRDEKGEYNIEDMLQGKDVKVDCYNGDSILMKSDLSSDGLDISGWKYSLSNNDIKSFPSDSIITFKSKTNGNLKVFYEYSGDYYTSKKNWYESDEYKLDFSFYPIPTLVPELNDSTENAKWDEKHTIDVYAGNYPMWNNVVMKYKSDNAGYPNGWTYTWTVDKDAISTNTSTPTFTYVPKVTTNQSYEDKNITVHVVNKIDNDNIGLDTTYTYPIRVWRKAEFPSDFTLMDVTQNRIMSSGVFPLRDGNVLSASVPAIKYGYNNEYNYEWYGDYYKSGNDCITWNDSLEIFKNENNMKDASRTYKLKMFNIGPTGNVWDSSDVLTHQVKVYNRPSTPISIVQKGNGTSRTMIATADVSDQDLQGREYYLVFGYTDETGVDHDFASQQQLNPGQVRWSKPFGNLQQMSDAYVYAVWKYGNAEITSGKCMLTGIDEDYDSSTYNSSTRAAIGEDNPNAIDVASEISDVRGVYSLNGVKVGSTLSDLKPGLYIVEFTNGVTNKIIVK